MLRLYHLIEKEGVGDKEKAREGGMQADEIGKGRHRGRERKAGIAGYSV